MTSLCLKKSLHFLSCSRPLVNSTLTKSFATLGTIRFSRVVWTGAAKKMNFVFEEIMDTGNRARKTSGTQGNVFPESL